HASKHNKHVLSGWKVRHALVRAQLGVKRQLNRRALRPACPFEHSSSDRRIDGLAAFRDRRADLNNTGLQSLRYLALEVDRQQPVLHVSTPHFDMVGELEAALESAGCDAAVEELALRIRFFLLTSDRESVLFHLDLDVLLAEPSDCHGDAVLVLGK